jgi:urease accessory protein
MYVDTSCSDTPAPVRMQRAEGCVRLKLRRRAGATRLETLFQEGCGKARLPKGVPGQTPEAILINTAGGLTGGDRLSTEIAVGQGASAIVTTQASERIYRSTGDVAQISNRLIVEAGARLAWLPQETILFDGGKLARTLDVNLQADAELLCVEAILFGRAAMGETVRSGSIHDRWRVRRDRHLIFADDFRVDGDIVGQLARPATLGGRSAIATILYCAKEPERMLDPVRAVIGDDGGASAWGGKLLVRLITESGLALRRKLEPLLALLLHGQPLPKVWQL